MFRNGFNLFFFLLFLAFASIRILSTREVTSGKTEKKKVKKKNTWARTLASLLQVFDVARAVAQAARRPEMAGLPTTWRHNIQKFVAALPLHRFL